jgi:hypothetical protein
MYSLNLESILHSMFVFYGMKFTYYMNNKLFILHIVYPKWYHYNMRIFFVFRKYLESMNITGSLSHHMYIYMPVLIFPLVIPKLSYFHHFFDLMSFLAGP